MRPGPDQAHLSFEHIEQLRQLVERGAPQEAAESRDSWVVPGGLRYRRAVFAHGHATELIDGDFFAVQAVSTLAEQSRPWGGDLDADGECSHQRSENNYRNTR